MTIKRRLFFSNLRMTLISFGAVALAIRIVTLLVSGTGQHNQEIITLFRDSYSKDMRMIIVALFFAFFIILISVMNNFLTLRMTKRIVKPLQPLNEGVKQIHNNNFAYRINYQNEDEFLPICEAFDEMSAKLETSTEQQKKDETNRREIIAGLSHDLRTPLTSIIGCIEGIETGVASTPEKQKQYHAFIKNEAVHMKHIIEQLFLFSKLDMDEFPLSLHNIDITLAISEMLEDSLAEYENQGLSIHIAEMPKNILVSADVHLLRNAIINIVGNSVKYKTKEHGRIEINAAVEDNYISLRFADDGPGVEAETLPKLLDVFYRADPSRSKIGSGLGLAISAKIIQRMGGKINAELPPQGGLAIVIRLPLLQGERK